MNPAGESQDDLPAGSGLQAELWRKACRPAAHKLPAGQAALGQVFAGVKCSELSWPKAHRAQRGFERAVCLSGGSVVSACRKLWDTIPH